jgi:hypothetical protein
MNKVMMHSPRHGVNHSIVLGAAEKEQMAALRASSASSISTQKTAYNSASGTDSGSSRESYSVATLGYASGLQEMPAGTPRELGAQGRESVTPIANLRDSFVGTNRNSRYNPVSPMLGINRR